MAGSLKDLERRVGVLEARMNGADADRAVIREQLNALMGGQATILQTLQDQGRVLAIHEARFDRIDDRLDRIDDRLEMVVDWIQRQP